MASRGTLPRGRGALPRVALVGVAAAACAWLATSRGGAPAERSTAAFTGASSTVAFGPAGSRAEVVIRRAGSKGFAPVVVVKRKRKKVNADQIKADHGVEKAPVVEEILRGGLASCPEDMVRARFSAIRTLDALFLARTERDDMRKTLEKRARGWALLFGEEEYDEKIDKKGEAKPGNSEAEKLRTAKSLEIVASTKKEVEFKLVCETHQLHARDIFKEDEKRGFIFSGDSVFSRWESLEAPDEEAEEPEAAPVAPEKPEE